MLRPWKSKMTETIPIPEVSFNSACANFLTTNCIQKLSENEVATVSAMNQAFVDSEDQIMETYSKEVRAFIHVLPTLTHI